MNKKLRKFIRSPRLFIKDMLLKRQAKQKPVINKVTGEHKYSVVSATYNVGRYLDKYFESLINQRLDFESHLQLILVDDGSSDDSADIIQKWQRRHPKNIVYIRKENGGQASARNLGIEQAAHPWITFIDPDDFVDINYFLEVDQFLKNNKAKNLQMLACNLIFYFEGPNHFKDTHPLKYKYTSGNKIFPYNNLEKHIQLAVHSAIFKADIIKKNGIRFDPRVRPVFEDGLFVSHYLSVINQGTVGFASKPKYFYRKRDDGTSTLDTAWSHPGRLDAVLQHGHLGSLRTHRINNGTIAPHIQRMSLYDVMWITRYFLSNPQRHAFMSEEARTRALTLLDQIFQYIDVKTILEFELAGCWFMHKVGMLGTFKQASPSLQIAYIDDVDPVKNQIQIRIFSKTADLPVSMRVDGNDIIPDHSKIIEHDFLGRNFVNEHRFWIHVPADKSILRLYSEGKEVILTMAQEQHRSGLRGSAIYQHFWSTLPKRPPAEKFRDAWILMDRDTRADDNAEHLYRHLQKHHSEINTFFALREDSADWHRLKEDGFRLLAFNSEEHLLALRCASKVISSHADAYASDLLGTSARRNYHFVFLQHGITQNDLSHWLNTKKIDCFITSAHAEYQSIGGQISKYKFSDKEVVLSGFPRHDQLLELDGTLARNTILVMPTWRNSLMGPAINSGAERVVLASIEESSYFKHWMTLLASAELKSLAEQHQAKIIFVPHTNLSSFMNLTPLPDHVELHDQSTGSMQTLFNSAQVLITDYSSVSFEVAILGQPVVYYQFDEEEFFGGGHTTGRGYFDYRKHGFGPVVTTQKDVIEVIAKALDRDEDQLRTYQARADLFFAFRDSGNCDRVITAIQHLDSPRDPGHINIPILRSFAKTAFNVGAWELTLLRYQRLAEQSVPLTTEEIDHYLTAVFFQSKVWIKSLRYSHCAKHIDSVLGLAGVDIHPLFEQLSLTRAEVAGKLSDWDLALKIWHSRSTIDPEAPYRLAAIYRTRGHLDEAYATLCAQNVRAPKTQAEWQLMADLALALADWTSAAEALRRMAAIYPKTVPAGTLDRALALEKMRGRPGLRPSSARRHRHTIPSALAQMNTIEHEVERDMH